MNIETVEDLSNQIADWLGVYGACKHADCGEECNATNKECCLHGGGCNDENPLCCRKGFMLTMPDRIKKAVENDIKLEKADL